MKSKILFTALLGGMFLSGQVRADDIQPYNRQNSSNYEFDGHTIDQVVVAPYGNGPRKKLSVSKEAVDGLSVEDLDNQVVFLYHPKTGRFVSADGDWGTETVARYPGFGMPFNLVNPKGTGSPVGDFVYGQEKVGYGFYSEAFDQGHYIGREPNNYAGQPEITQNGEKTNRIRFYTDRGGTKNDAAWVEELQASCRPNVNGKFSPTEGSSNFCWGLDKVNLDDNNLNVYRLYVYIQNDKVYSYDQTEQLPPFYKNYVKVEPIDCFGDGILVNILTCNRANTETNKNVIQGDETPDDLKGDPEDYYWQLITRRDLKEKFLLDFEDPYNAKVENGNATYNIDNPDFSRPLSMTVNPGGRNVPAFWKESSDDVYNHDGNWTNSDYGRFCFMNPEANGTLTQSFKPYQHGLFRLDCQGFAVGDANVTMQMKADDNRVVVSNGGTIAFDHVGNLNNVDGNDLTRFGEGRFDIRRAVGQYFYDENNAGKFVKSLYVYVPDNADPTQDVTITFTFYGVDANNYRNNFIALDNVRLTYAGDTPFILDENAKAELSQEKIGEKEHPWIPVYLNRHFDEGAWNAFVCPVPLNWGQMKGAFGEGTKVSEISIEGLSKDNPYVIVFNDKTPAANAANSTAVIAPGHFYLVKPSAVTYTKSLGQIRNDGTNFNVDVVNAEHFVFLGSHNLSPATNTKGNDSELLPGANNNLRGSAPSAHLSADNLEDSYKSILVDESNPYGAFYTTRYYMPTRRAAEPDHNPIKLIGSYLPQTIPAAQRGDSYVFATRPGSSAIVHLSENGGNFSLPGFRFYIQDFSTGEFGGAKTFNFTIDGVEDGDEFAGILNALSEGSTATGDIYTISGQKVAGKLAKGVYVKNGKKFFVK